MTLSLSQSPNLGNYDKGKAANEHTSAAEDGDGRIQATKGEPEHTASAANPPVDDVNGDQSTAATGGNKNTNPTLHNTIPSIAENQTIIAGDGTVTTLVPGNKRNVETKNIMDSEADEKQVHQCGKEVHDLSGGDKGTLPVHHTVVDSTTVTQADKKGLEDTQQSTPAGHSSGVSELHSISASSKIAIRKDSERKNSDSDEKADSVIYKQRPGSENVAEASNKITARFANMFNRRKEHPVVQAANYTIRESDIIIAITDAVGGDDKRAFVESAVGEDACREKSVHGKIGHVVDRHSRDPKRRTIVVYNTGSRSFADQLRDITTWLNSVGGKRRLSGLIHLEDVTKAQPQKSLKLSRKSLDLLHKRMDRPNFVLVTIGWDDHDSAGARERAEKEVGERWNAYTDRGAGMYRLSLSKGPRGDSLTSRDLLDHAILMVDKIPTTWTRGIYIGREGKADDEFLDARFTDIVIPVMGPTGAGKSTFINTVAGKDVAKVGHNLKSQTAQLQHVIIPHPDDKTRRIVLVDTPGFDDTYIADSEILRRIAVWLARSYTANMKLSGVIYLHEISQTRMLGTARKNLDMFNKLCGAEATENVILVTTKWSEVKEDVGVRRESQLKERHWKCMLELEAQSLRFLGSMESGWAIIQQILEKVDYSNVDAVAIQNELVELAKNLPDTAAGRTLRYTLEELLETQRKAAAQLRQDPGSAELDELIQENETKMLMTLKQLKEMNIPGARRLRDWIQRRFVRSTGHS